jgi:sortase system peptidoglycan-associated protein
MKLKPIVFALALAGITHSTMASEPITVEEKRSIVSGLIIGGSIGGPFGAGVGAIFGREVIGKLFASKRINKELQTELSNATTVHRTEKNTLNKSITALNQDLDKLVALQTNRWKKQELPIQFKTGSSEIEPHYQAQLVKIALVLNRNKDASVTLSGFADRRGESDYNQQLSEERVNKVHQYLLARGAQNGQVLTMAYGESRPLNQTESSENNFFDRRVVLALSLDIDSQLATR